MGDDDSEIWVAIDALIDKQMPGEHLAEDALPFAQYYEALKIKHELGKPVAVTREAAE